MVCENDIFKLVILVFLNIIKLRKFLCHKLKFIMQHIESQNTRRQNL